jgi:hypothetical protein
MNERLKSLEREGSVVVERRRELMMVLVVVL